MDEARCHRAVLVVAAVVVVCMEAVGSTLIVVHERHFALTVPMIVLDLGNSFAYISTPVLFMTMGLNEVSQHVYLAVNASCIVGVWLLLLLPLSHIEWYLTVSLHSF
jgi:hypothetical protein